VRKGPARSPTRPGKSKSPEQTERTVWPEVFGIPMLELDADMGRNDLNSKSIKMKSDRVSIHRDKD